MPTEYAQSLEAASVASANLQSRPYSAIFRTPYLSAGVSRDKSGYLPLEI